MRKKLMVFASFLLIPYLSFALDKEKRENCLILTKIMELCVYDLTMKCQDKQVALFYSLTKRGIDKEVAKRITTLCGTFCLAPDMFSKEEFFKGCINAEKNFSIK